MATIQTSKSVQPTTINKFLGLNLSNTGDTQIQLGESGNMTNFYITDDLKLRKMYGYKMFHWFTETLGYIQNNKVVRGMFAAKIGNAQYLLVAAGGKLYKFLQSELDDEENWNNITAYEIGVIPDVETSFFEFDNKVYILCSDQLNGKYLKWDGTSLNEVEGYVPTVFVNSYPAGGGTIYDEINMLSPYKIQTFNGDGTSTVYQLAQKDIKSVSFVKVTDQNGTTTYTEVVNNPGATQYKVDKIKGTVTFGSAPLAGNDNVEIKWEKADNDRYIIEGMRFGTIFGGDVDTRVFLYGNPSYQNRVYFSGTTFENGVAVPSVEYFPATSQLDIGPANFAVTDLTRQYDRLIASTNKPEAYYLTISTEQIPVTIGDQSATRYVPSVGTFPLNEAHGNVAYGQGRLLMNYPVTFEDGAVIMWKASNVRDEKNAEEISQKIKIDLDRIPMREVKTLDLQEDSQLWIIYDTKVWIYNYENKTYSRLNLEDAVDNITSLNGNVYMSTTEGKVIKFSKNFTTYDGNTIKAYWEMNFADFGVPYLRKTMNRLWVSMQPQNWSSADVSFISNVAESIISKHIEYKKQWFDNVDFKDFHFTSSINPQPFKLKLKAKKFTNLKITIKNEENSTCTILNLVLQIESFGYSK